MRNVQSDYHLILGSFIRMLFVDMFVLMTMSICGFVDSLVISRRRKPLPRWAFSRRQHRASGCSTWW